MSERIEGPFPVPEGLGALLRAAIEEKIGGQGCSDPDCKGCNGKHEAVRDLTLQEFEAHLAMTSYKPQVGHRVRLNNYGKGWLRFPGDARAAFVVRVLDQPVYDQESLNNLKGANGQDTVLAFMVGAGRIIELLYPSTGLERVEG